MLILNKQDGIDNTLRVCRVFNRPPAFAGQIGGGRRGLAVSGGRKVLQEKPVSVPAAAPVEFCAEVRECTAIQNL